MYYSGRIINALKSVRIGFDAFIAPDDFDRTAQPVDIYEIFKYYYATDQKIRYVYYYMDGNYPLTLTPTATEYYKYGYYDTVNEVYEWEDVPLNSSPVTIFSDTTHTERWVAVYRTTDAKIAVVFNVQYAKWYYLGPLVYSISLSATSNSIEIIHFADSNSITTLFDTYGNTNMLKGRCTVPKVNGLSPYFITDTGITKVTLPKDRPVYVNYWQYPSSSLRQNKLVELNLGATTSIPFSDTYWHACENMSILSASSQNTRFLSYEGCDVLYSKDGTEILWFAFKTKRGLIIPDTLPLSQFSNMTTIKFGLGGSQPYNLSWFDLQGYPLHIGTLITDITNLWLFNKSFNKITVGAGNTAYVAEDNILYNSQKTSLIKAATSIQGAIVIPDTVTNIRDAAFLRCPNTEYRIYSNAAPIITGTPFSTPCVLHVKQGATGYNVSPWTNTAIFTNIIYDL